MSDRGAPADVVLVTVTYGDREAYLSECLAEAHRQGVRRFVIISNQANFDVGAIALRLSGSVVDLALLEGNYGSAVGYSLGLRLAVGSGARFVLMLDDDNQLGPGTLQRLLDLYVAKAEDPLRAVFGHRADRGAVSEFQRSQAALVDGRGFWGFRLGDLPAKLLKRLGPTAPAEGPANPVRLAVGPYGGMLTERSTIEALGFPDERLFLYIDDTEYTYRLMQAGGVLWLAPDATITDLEGAWSQANVQSSGASHWLTTPSDLRALYGARNLTYFQSHVVGRAPSAAIDKAGYLAILWVIAVMKGRLPRLRKLLEAIAEGEAGRLVHPAPETRDFERFVAEAPLRRLTPGEATG